MNYNKSLTATVYIVKNQRVLLHIHRKYKTWFPVGGHIESSELPHEAALREAKEESGMTVRLFEKEPDRFSVGLVERIPCPVAVYHEGIGGKEEFLDFIYIGIPEEGEISPEEGESSVFRWFSERELLDKDENIKIHIRNTALKCLYLIKNKDGEYFPADENAIY